MASSIAKRNAPLNAPFKNVGTVPHDDGSPREHNQQIDVIETLHPASDISSGKWRCWKWICLWRFLQDLLTPRQQQTFRLPTRSQRHSPIRESPGLCRDSLSRPTPTKISLLRDGACSHRGPGAGINLSGEHVMGCRGQCRRPGKGQRQHIINIRFHVKYFTGFLKTPRRGFFIAVHMG